MKNHKHKAAKISTIAVLLLTLFTIMIASGTKPQKALAFAGSGSSQDPYIITTCAELQALDNSEIDRQGDVFSLGNDIDCSMTNPSNPNFNNSGTWSDQQGFDPISNFDATLDGKGHTIIGLYEHRINGVYVGLFDNAPPLVTNLHIDSTSQFIGASMAGSIAAELYDHAIEGVTSAATVTSTGGPVGGLVGQTYGDSGVIFRHDAYTGTVTNVGNNSELGGLIGRSYWGFDISDSYVNAAINGGTAIGGLVGNSGYSQSCASRVLANSYASGVINTGGSGYAGGLFGNFDGPCNNDTKQIVNNFSTMTKGTGNAVYGGIIGFSPENVQIANTYFDQTNMGVGATCIQQSTGIPDISTCNAVNGDGTDGAHFKNTTSVEPISGNDGWDFVNTWQTSAGELPSLKAYTSNSGPDAIQNLVLTPLSNARINVSFDPVSGWGGLPEGYYDFEIKKSSESWDGNLINHYSLGNGTQTVSNTYVPGTSVDVRVAAVSKYGRGPWTSLSTTTLPVVVQQIASCADLQAIDDVEDVGTLDTYVLTQDIDCDGVDFEPIGYDSNGWDESSFRGIFDGQGHTISNLTIDQGGSWEVGLFYELNGATVRNLAFQNGSVTGGGEVASVAGYVYNGGSFSDITSNLTINGSQGEIGGMLGYAEADETGSLQLDNLSYTGDITSNGSYVGGLIGYNETYDGHTTTISHSSASGTISSTDGAVGGLVGYSDLESYNNETDEAGLYISNSYSQMNIEANGYAGGLVGELYTYNSNNEPLMLQINSSYASGEINSTDYSSGLIGYVDGLDTNQSIEINDSFAAFLGLENGPNYALVSGDGFVNSGSMIFTNTFFDNVERNNVTGPSEAAYDFTSGTTGITDDASYFLGNNANQPMSTWDFTSTWGTVDAGFPILSTAVDNDTDGASTTVESAAPNGGDANNDGFPDAYQDNVTSFVDTVTGHYAVVETSCSANQGIQIGSEAGDGHGDAAFDYPAGLVDFRGTSCSSSDVTVTQYYYGNFDATKLTLRKWHDDIYTTVTDAVLTNETIGGQPVLKIVYYVVDGGPLDDDGTVNGQIHDPSGPALINVGAPSTGLGGSIN
ncbi:MAG: choice-of-anchor U domain-containing protein [Candidatus Saccharibacteria bacterium]